MSVLVDEPQIIKSFSLAPYVRDRELPGVMVPTITEEPYRILDRAGYQLAMGAVPEQEGERPPQAIVRGRCPECGEEIVANMYWHADRGYLLRYECWEGLMPAGRCHFYAVP